MIFELDGRCMTDRDALHTHVMQQLSLPEWYGRNLDALYDVLTELRDCTIVLRNVSCLPDSLNEYPWLAMRTIIDAAKENPSLELKMYE